jgi:predicted DNA-binding transcriptional regulator AlpA
MKRRNLRDILTAPAVLAPTMLDIHDLVDLTHYSSQTIYRGARQGTFPRPVIHMAGAKAARWLTADYVRWVEQQQAEFGEARIRTHRER